jgi:hypothetical protein
VDDQLWWNVPPCEAIASLGCSSVANCTFDHVHPQVWPERYACSDSPNKCCVRVETAECPDASRLRCCSVCCRIDARKHSS